MWRVAGALFIAYPVVRIILEPPATERRGGRTGGHRAVRVAGPRRRPRRPRRRARRRHPVFAVMVLAILALAGADRRQLARPGLAGPLLLRLDGSQHAPARTPCRRSHRRRRRGVRRHPVDLAGLRERLHPGPVGVDHRDHGVRDGRAAKGECAAPRRARGARGAGRRRGAQPDRPRPARRPRPQPVAHRDQERAGTPAAARGPRSSQGRDRRRRTGRP